MVKPDSREKPISFMFMLPDFADASKDIRIGFANKGKTDPRIRIEWSLDKIDNSVGFSMDSRLLLFESRPDTTEFLSQGRKLLYSEIAVRRF